MALRSASGERLSYSSMNLIQGCQRRWHHYKVLGTEKDPDNSTSNALEVGSAFHRIQEELNHDISNLGPATEKLGTRASFDALTNQYKDICVSQDKLNEEDWPLVAALALGYLGQIKFRRPSLKCVGVEKELIDDNYIGYVDAIMVDEKTKLFWIIDLKTSGYALSATKKIQLKGNTQLNLYAAYAKQLAEACGISDLTFGGCGYFSAVKPKLKKRVKDTDFTYFERLFDQTCKREFLDLEMVPADTLSPHKALNLHKALYELSQDIRSGRRKPIPNYNYCEQYFRPCPYFSKCHGSCAG